MKLERHIGGLSLSRKVNYLVGRQWREQDGGWLSPIPGSDPLPIKWAVHQQLTHDLARGLSAWGWKVAGYSQRGYAQMEDPLNLKHCSLPAALRRQARRDGRRVGELTYSLFLAALL